MINKKTIREKPMKSLYVRNGILKILSDGRLHTMSEISEELEVNRLTVYRHITALTPYYNITSFKGRYGGGVKMLEAFDTYIVLTEEEIDRIMILLRNSGINDDVIIITKLKRIKNKYYGEGRL